MSQSIPEKKEKDSARKAVEVRWKSTLNATKWKSSAYCRLTQKKGAKKKWVNRREKGGKLRTCISNTGRGKTKAVTKAKRLTTNL